MSNRSADGAPRGTQYYLIEFRNVSDHTCQMRGYPGVSAIANGHQVGNTATWDSPIPISTVTLQPAATAHSVLGIRNAGNYPAELCDQLTATALKVYPPNESTPIYVAYGIQRVLGDGNAPTRRMAGRVRFGLLRTERAIAGHRPTDEARGRGRTTSRDGSGLGTLELRNLRDKRGI